MKKYNKYGAAHRNAKRFEVEYILHKDENAAVFRIYSDKDEFMLYFLPNYENKTVEVSTDRDTKFSDAVVQFLANNGDIQNIMEAVFTKSFKQSPANRNTKEIPLNLPSLNLPSFTS